jgi:thiol-disulfide isomerase/thioredoxin
MKRLLLIAFVLVGFVGAQALETPAPDFVMYSPTLEQAVQLSKLKGKPVVLNFWGSWCPPCRDEMEDLNAVAIQFKDKFVLLSIPSNEPYQTSLEYLKAQDLTGFTVLTESPAGQTGLDSSSTVNERYQVKGYPTTVFVDKDGIVMANVLGPLSRRTFISMLKNVDVTP